MPTALTRKASLLFNLAGLATVAALVTGLYFLLNDTKVDHDSSDGTFVIFTRANCGDAFSDGHYAAEADSNPDDAFAAEVGAACEDAKRPKLIVGWSLTAVGALGLPAAAVYARRRAADLRSG
ncbi:hypothetical protein O7599_21965 [Streptomyces sp. WMMC500]|uniref:hypothetical protein n=1 Tax=Streptomyces sp. WMMC500 TaxID=3015154 RepID=UPI00248BC90E|nr:hypothetical protein [Streptomyces sp. WMMC500]WBB58302.1 hypothetical protein O7599_21965 [Streptomyces sp. WMMC500]